MRLQPPWLVGPQQKRKLLQVHLVDPWDSNDVFKARDPQEEMEKET